MKYYINRAIVCAKLIICIIQQPCSVAYCTILNHLNGEGKKIRIHLFEAEFLSSQLPKVTFAHRIVWDGWWKVGHCQVARAQHSQPGLCSCSALKASAAQSQSALFWAGEHSLTVSTLPATAPHLPFTQHPALGNVWQCLWRQRCPHHAAHRACFGPA